jgi:pimeloyl-ACP methyl ester carboxylesterase
VVDWSEERFAEVGEGIQLCYQTVGDPADPPLLLIAGVGAQMIAWPDGFCELLAQARLRVIRFDNRDAGRSTWLEDAAVPSLSKAWAHELVNPPYLLSDMAGDAAGLLDRLGIGAAHVVGVSLGGFIAQTLAIERPERVLSLASIMSSTGSAKVGQATEEAMGVLMTRPPEALAAFTENLIAARRAIGSPKLGIDERWLRDLAARMYARGVNPDGTQRQLVASICSGSRADALPAIEAPTVVVHGTDDPLIGISGGEATAAAIPGATLALIEDMGHDLPEAAWAQVVEAIAFNLQRRGSDGMVGPTHASAGSEEDR